MSNIKLPYKIKRRYPHIATYALVSFVMLVLALLCLFSPFIPYFSSFTKSMQRVYMLIGGVCTPFFAFTICYSILNIISPSVAFTVNEKGFIDRTMADGGVGFIPSGAIISLKLFGTKKKQFLGIRLDTDGALSFGKSKKARQEIQSNIESGMPAIIIRECDLKISVRELLKIMLEVYGESTQKPEMPIEHPVEIVNIPTEAEDGLSNALYNDAVDSRLDDEVLEIVNDDGAEQEILEGSTAVDDIPLTVDFDSDKPRISNIDDLLSHILIKKDTDKQTDEK